MAKVFIPRLGLSVSETFLRSAVRESVQQLGYQQPTEEQEEALMKFAGGKDVFIALPTGSGKSVCFASVSLVFDRIRRLKAEKELSQCSVTIVVSPLAALMQDQVSKFSARGLQAAFVANLHEKPSVQEKALNGMLQLLYFSPEVLLSVKSWREMLRASHYQDNIVCFAVDEAHLVDKW